MTKYQRELFSARLLPRCDKVETKPFAKAMLSLISKTHVSTGNKYDEKAVLVTLPELIKEIRTYFGYLTFPEIELFFRNGWKEEYGEYFGLNNKTYLMWIRCGSQEDSRLKAIKAMENAKKELEPKPKELTEAEKDAIVEQGALKCFERYKKDSTLLDIGNVTYNLLVKKGLLAFTLEVKLEIQAKAKEVLKLRETGKLQDPGMIGQHHVIRQAIADISEGKGDALVVECKRIALKKYFDQLIEMEEDLVFNPTL